MPRMRAPYTGIVFDVLPENVEKRAARGFALLDQHEHPSQEPEPEEVEQEPAPEADAQKPGAYSTISEVRAWAKANGVKLPAKGNKAQLLKAIEEAGL